MRGVNKLTLNQETVCDALEDYVNNLFTTPIEVTHIAPVWAEGSGAYSFELQIRPKLPPSFQAIVDNVDSAEDLPF